MSDHNGHLVEPTDKDRFIISNMLDAIVATRKLLEAYITLIEVQHLFLEVEAVNLNWICSHLNESEKELNRLKERVQDV